MSLLPCELLLQLTHSPGNNKKTASHARFSTSCNIFHVPSTFRNHAHGLFYNTTNVSDDVKLSESFFGACTLFSSLSLYALLSLFFSKILSCGKDTSLSFICSQFWSTKKENSKKKLFLVHSCFSLFFLSLSLSLHFSLNNVVKPIFLDFTFFQRRKIFSFMCKKWRIGLQVTLTSNDEKVVFQAYLITVQVGFVWTSLVTNRKA